MKDVANSPCLSIPEPDHDTLHYSYMREAQHGRFAINKIYRLTLDFTVWMNDELLHPYSDEDELDMEEKRQLQAQRSLLRALLDDKQGVLEELIRKRVLEDADGAVDVYELRERLL